MGGVVRARRGDRKISFWWTNNVNNVGALFVAARERYSERAGCRLVAGVDCLLAEGDGNSVRQTLCRQQLDAGP